MPKTRNAFALRDFDAQRILQRRWFKDLDLPTATDKAVLGFFNDAFIEKMRETSCGFFRSKISPTGNKYLDVMLEKLDKITRLANRAGGYEVHIERHVRRLNEIQKIYVEKFLSTEDKTYKQKLIRVTKLIKSYREVLNSATALRSESELKEEMANATHKSVFRQYFFGSRLRQKRKAAGMTQQQLAARVGLNTYNAISQYEKGISDPSLLTLYRISKVLKCSLDWLIGSQ